MSRSSATAKDQSASPTAPRCDSLLRSATLLCGRDVALHHSRPPLQQSLLSHGFLAPRRNLAAQVQGLGPIFRLRISVLNTGRRPVSEIVVSFKFNSSLYRFKQSLIKVSASSCELQSAACVPSTRLGLASIRLETCSSCLPIECG
eukprot:scaffold17808_cov33-Tisochrysis_lutea.AAC.4